MTPEWHEQRRLGIGGSDANVILGGDKEKIIQLWKVKRGEVEPEDLSAVLPVRMGQATEAFNIQWFQERTGQSIILQQLAITSQEIPWMRCTLDGVVDTGEADVALMPIFEAKHCNAFMKRDEALKKYYPQLQHNMRVTTSTKAFMSVFYGTLDWHVFEVEADPIYQAQMIEAEKHFWECVQSGTPPVAVEVHVPVEAVRVVDMTGSNEWGVHAHLWLQNKPFAKAFDVAAKSLKDMVEADVSEAHGHGIVISRSKTGSLTIREARA